MKCHHSHRCFHSIGTAFTSSKVYIPQVPYSSFSASTTISRRTLNSETLEKDALRTMAEAFQMPS